MATIISTRAVFPSRINTDGVPTSDLPNRILKTNTYPYPSELRTPSLTLPPVDGIQFDQIQQTATTRGPATTWRKFIPTQVRSNILNSTYGLDFYEVIHTFPTTNLLGTVLTDHTEQFELYNAQRNTDESLIQILREGQGVEDVVLEVTGSGDLFEDVAPIYVGALTSHSFSYTIPAQGPALIDVTLSPVVASLRATYPIRIAGRRAVVFPFIPETGLTETIENNTNVMMSKSGKETRTAERTTSRQSFGMRYFLNSQDERQYQKAQAMVSGNAGNEVGVGMWHMSSKLTNDMVVGGDTVQLDQQVLNLDIRDNGYIMLWTDWQTNEVLSVGSSTGSTISLASPVSSPWPAGSYVVPVHLCNAHKAISIQRHRNNTSFMDIRWDSRSLTTSLDDISAVYPVQFRGKPVFNDDHFMEGSSTTQGIDLGTKIVGSESGNMSYLQDSESLHSTGKTWHADTREETTNLRKMAFGFRGRQKSFYVPTNRDDMSILPLQTIPVGGDTFYIDNAPGYGSTLDTSPEGPYNNLQVELKDGTKGYAQIESLVAQTQGDFVTLVEPFGISFVSSDVRRISFLHEMRLSNDKFTLTHTGQGYSSAKAALIGVRKQ
jgi:hypothetical protein